AVLVIGGMAITSTPGDGRSPGRSWSRAWPTQYCWSGTTSDPSGHQLAIGGAAVAHGGLELEHDGLVDPHLEELAVAHHVGTHGRSGHHSGSGRLQHHPAALLKKVGGAPTPSGGAPYQHPPP